jgi:hypothetical protein
VTATDLAPLTDAARLDLHHWRGIIEPLLAAEHGVVAMIRQAAAETGEPEGTIRRKYYAVKKQGMAALIDRRALPSPNSQLSTINSSDRELLRTYVERNQRCSEAGIRALRRDWRRGVVNTDTPLDPRTGYPRGWSPRNLARYAPSRFELRVARIGRSAAASERRLVYTTRRDLWVGSHYLFDDIWHDHFVNCLARRLSGRPMEFHALDLFSANKFAWGMRVRTEAADGKMEHLKEADMRFLLACVLGGYGYSQRGTVLVAEHGTAAIPAWLEELIHNETGGLITVARSGMEGAAAAAHQYAGRSKGNFRFKAALESLGNLIHNEMAALPGQTGLDRDHRPEQLHGLLKYNDALLMAVAQLPPERAEMLQWPLLTLQQFLAVAGEIYERINAREDHDLEGWDMHHVPDRRTGLMRRLAPREVWRAGARQLTRLRPEAVAMILVRDSGTERIARRGMFELADAEITGDLLRFDARDLTDREKYLTVLNPYAPDTLYAFDSRGRYVAACPRIHSVNRADVEAVQRECGAAAKAETERLVPFRARHLAAGREKRDMHRNNARILAGDPVTPSRLHEDSDAFDAATERTALPLQDDADSLADALRELT